MTALICHLRVLQIYVNVKSAKKKNAGLILPVRIVILQQKNTRIDKQYLLYEETMKDPEMTLRLSHREIEYLKRYAEEHKVTVKELVDRYIKRLQPNKRRAIHRDVKKMSGIIPSDVETKDSYHTHLLKKHQ